MTIVAVVEAVALVVAVFLFLRHLSQLERAKDARERELLNRITHPEIVPVAAPREFIVPDDEPDEIDLVGVIQDSPELDLQ